MSFFGIQFSYFTDKTRPLAFFYFVL